MKRCLKVMSRVSLILIGIYLSICIMEISCKNLMPNPQYNEWNIIKHRL